MILSLHCTEKMKQNFSRETGVKALDWVSEKWCSILGSTTHLLWELVEQDTEQEWRLQPRNFSSVTFPLSLCMRVSFSSLQAHI